MLYKFNIVRISRSSIVEHTPTLSPYYDVQEPDLMVDRI